MGEVAGVDEHRADRTDWRRAGAALGLLGALVAVRDNVWIALSLGGLALAVVVRGRKRLRGSPPPAPAPGVGVTVTLQDFTIDGSRVIGGPIVGIGAGGNSTVDAERIAISGFDKGVDARDSAKVSIRDSELTGPGTTRTPGRNAPCPCGSGKTYKNCHGK